MADQEVTPPSVPSLEEIRKALADSDSECYHLLCRLRDLLQSGEYALVSRDDRMDAMNAAMSSASAYERGQDYKSHEREARKLLQLGDPT